jgi:hypothetical protein
MSATNRLDDLLSAPLPALPDAGFSARVLARIARREWLASLFRSAVFLAGGLGVLLLIPASAIERAMAVLSSGPAASLPFALAAAAIVLTLTLEQFVRQR